MNHIQVFAEALRSKQTDCTLCNVQLMGAEMQASRRECHAFPSMVNARDSPTGAVGSKQYLTFGFEIAFCFKQLMTYSS